MGSASYANLALRLAGWLLVSLGLLACRVPSFLYRPTPTLEPLVIRVVVQQPGQPLDNLLPTATPLPLSGQPVATLTPGLIPTDTPIPTATFPPTPVPTFTPVPAATLPPTPAATMAVVESPTPMPAPPGNIYTGPVTDRASLLDPQPGFTLPVGQNQLEFKWHWRSNQPRPCELPEGYGFEVRIWPDPRHPGLAAQATVTPLGVIDAVKEQALIANSCDPKTDSRRLLVKGLKDAPGVKAAGSSGHFFWDVAYIKLKPSYQVLEVSASRDFFILAPP